MSRMLPKKNIRLVSLHIFNLHVCLCYNCRFSFTNICFCTSFSIVCLGAMYDSMGLGKPG